MLITVDVQLAGQDNFAYTPDAAAAQVLAALGGNPTKDYCAVNVKMPLESGTAGTPPPPEPGMP